MLDKTHVNGEAGPAVSPGTLKSLREHNRARVIDALRGSPGLSRTDVMRATGLSRATVSSIVGELLESGIVVERSTPRDDAERQGTGRPPVLLALHPGAGLALGVDFGHRHLRVALADLSSQVLAERRIALDVDRSATAGLDAATELVGEVIAEAGAERDRIIGCGMGLPGPIDRLSGTVGSSVILPGWSGEEPAPRLARRLGVPVTVDNDANLGALGEATFGAGRGVSDLVYVKVASGIGAGIVLGGRIHRGTRGLAGELGHVRSEPQGRLCRCGSRGCLETVAAAPALLELLREAQGDQLTINGLLELVREGDVGASRLVADAGRAIGRALADTCNLLNPELIVVGGELSEAGEPLITGVRDSLQRYGLPASVAEVRVVAAELADRAEVLGAVSLVIADGERLRAAGLPDLTFTPNTTDTPIRGGAFT